MFFKSFLVLFIQFKYQVVISLCKNWLEGFASCKNINISQLKDSRIHISLENAASLLRSERESMGEISDIERRKRIFLSKSHKLRRERELLLYNLEIQEEKESLFSKKRAHPS